MNFNGTDTAVVFIYPQNEGLLFPPAGAEPYKRNLKTVEYHLIDAAHLALETDGDTIAKLMREFLGKHVPRNRRTHQDGHAAAFC